MVIEKVTFSNMDSISNNFLGFKRLCFGKFSRPLFPFKKLNPQSSNSAQRSPEERTNSIVMKSNEANNRTLIAEINRSAEPEGSYSKLLPEYSAYKNPKLSDLTRVSQNTLSALYRGQSVEIKINDIDDEKRQEEINFADGSQISYTTFLKDGKINLNEEDFDIPAGTVVETKSVNGRIFSKLIQLPNMSRKVIEKPEYLNEAEQILIANA